MDKFTIYVDRINILIRTPYADKGEGLNGLKVSSPEIRSYSAKNIYEGMGQIGMRIALSSVTWAMKAQDALRDFGIESAIVRLRPGESPRGCSYGIEFSNNMLERVRTVLIGANIPHNVLLQR